MMSNIKLCLDLIYPSSCILSNLSMRAKQIRPQQALVCLKSKDIYNIFNIKMFFFLELINMLSMEPPCFLCALFELQTGVVALYRMSAPSNP